MVRDVCALIAPRGCDSIDAGKRNGFATAVAIVSQGTQTCRVMP